MARLAVHGSQASAEKSVGTFDAGFDIPLTFDLKAGYSDALVLNRAVNLCKCKVS